METNEKAATASEEVFLSPRVVDREAFDDFSGVLRAIVDDAQTVGQTIEAKASLAKRSLAEFAKSEPTMNASIDAAGRALKSMDERIDRIEGLLVRVEEAGNKLEDRGAVASQRIDAREAQLEASLSDVIAKAEARLNTSAIEMTTRVEEVLRSTETALDQARSDASAMHVETVGQLNELNDRLVGELADAAAEGREQLRETLTKLEQEIEPTKDRIEATTGELEERLDRLRKQTLALMGPGVRQLESLCQRGGNLLGRDPEVIESEPSKPAEAGSLADIVERGEGLGDRAVTESNRLESIRSQAEAARTALTDSIISSSEWLDKLLEYQASLDGATAESVERCREAETALKQREEELKATLLEPAQTIEREMERVDELLQHVRASRSEAETLIERHEQTSVKAKADLERLDEVIAQVAHASNPSPKPSKSAPAGADENGTEALTEAVAAIKGELSGELGKMTRAIEMMMQSRPEQAATDSTIDAMTLTEPKASKRKSEAAASKTSAKKGLRTAKKAPARKSKASTDDAG